MALTSSTIANGSALQVFPPIGGDGGLPTSTYTSMGVGTLTANGATPVTVTDAGVTANSIIAFTLKTVGGTVSPNALNVLTITPGTGFTAAGTALDTSVYNYLRIG